MRRKPWLSEPKYYAYKFEERGPKRNDFLEEVGI